MRNPFKVIGGAIAGAFRGAVQGAREVDGQTARPAQAPQPERQAAPPELGRPIAPPPAIWPESQPPARPSLRDRLPGWLGGRRQAQPERQAVPIPRDVGRDVREAMERDRQAQAEAAAAREQLRQQSIEHDRQRAEDARQAREQRAREMDEIVRQAREQSANELLARYAPVQRLIIGDRPGTIYTVRDASNLNGRLVDAAMAGRRVVLSVLRSDGTWRQLFNESGRKYNRGMGANYMQSLVNQFGGGDLATWIAGGCTGGPGEYEDDDEVTDADGFQLYEFS